jgi:hypothetical protein
MRYFFRRRIPPLERVLLVESGSRHILEKGLPVFRSIYRGPFQADLLTCLPGLPQGLDPAATNVFSVTQCRSAAERRRLLFELRARRYSVVAVICSDEPVMTPWKVAAAAVLPAKIVVFNENADFFWVDWAHRKTLRQFLSYRAGLLEESAPRKIAQLAAFPFLLAYLLLYAGCVHARRAWRLGFGRSH